MSAKVTVKATPSAAKILQTFLVNTSWKASQEIAKEAKSICAVDTGKLRGSIKVVKEAEGIYKIGSQLPYAIFVEMGTRFQSPVGFLRRAFWNVLRRKV